MDELARIYHARGVPLEVACKVSKALSADLTGQAPARGGLRLFVIGGGAGVLAYLIGKVLGISV